MNKKIVVGTDNFEKFIRNNGYYVDKTELLYDLVAGTGNEVTLFTRPRRFGKTLTMSMMESFFDISRDSSDLFADRNISKNHPDFCKEWMNQYPVLSLTLKDVEGLTFESAFKMMKAVLGGLCKRVNSVIQDHASIIDPDDMKKFGRLKGETAELEEVKDSLNTLMRMLNAVYGKPVILLIDEYDVPLAKAEETKNQEFYRQMLDLIRGILSISMKTNDYLKFAVVTGCLRISKESIFTGVNNITCYAVTSRKFSRYFGFTQEEISEMLDAFGMTDKLDLIRQRYNSYVFGNTEVFCPWDVASYLSTVVDDKEGITSQLLN